MLGLGSAIPGSKEGEVLLNARFAKEVERPEGTLGEKAALVDNKFNTPSR
jgi:hypothetical protein